MSIRRVLVLARAGAACDHARAALQQAGAELLAVLDPTSADPQELRAAAPDAVLVVLDSAVEAALEKFDEVLADPALTVLYDDAEVAAKRDGWEAARWARHLAAKLYDHHDVLPAPPGGEEAFARDMAALSQQAAALPPVAQQAKASPPLPAHGAVVIVAGIGGPDAVRQLLGELPEAFPRAVLLRQRIEGGQYDRLMRQMQRAARMRVQLAQPGESIQGGCVYVLPDGLDVGETAEGLQFVATEGEPGFAALHAATSAILLLSGAPAALVDTALVMRHAGGLALGQAAENCFDPAASQSLVARGGEASSLAGMSRHLLQRWPA